MPLFVKAQSFLRNLFSTRSVETDLDQEVRSHLELLTDENVRAGMPPKEAQRAARLELGGTEQVKEQVREERIGSWIRSVIADCRYGARQLRKNPGFTTIAVMTLALGIGANTAIFSLVNAVLLRPLPLWQPGDIVRLQERHEYATNLTGATYRDVRQRNRLFTQVAAYRIFSRNLSDTSRAMPPEQIQTAFISQDFLALLGVAPLAGPGFGQEAFDEHAEKAVILSYGLWQRHFGMDSQIVGKMITLHGEPHLVAGVMPMGFSFPDAVQAWAPLTDDLAFRENRRAHLYTALARVKTGVSMGAVHADLQAISTQIQEENHDVDPGFALQAERLQDNLVSGVRPTLWILLGAVVFVLLIACANVANLLLSQSVAREKEIAVRSALGATGTRLARQLFTESALLGLLGGAAGCILGLGWVRGIYAAYPGALPGLKAPSINLQVFFFVFSASLLASVAFGSAPAAQSWRMSLQEKLVEGSRTTAGVRPQRIRSILMISEAALAMMLLAAAGLLIRSFFLLQRVNPGFQSSNLAVVRLSLPDSRYPALPERTRFMNSILERIRTLPGVLSVAVAGTLPFDPVPGTDLELEGHVYEPGKEPEAEILTASPEYFRTMGIRVLAGRTFAPQDVAGSPTVLVINQTMARRYWPGESALGKLVVMKDWGPPLRGEIVGVVSDVKQDSLETVTQPAIYYSFAQFSQGTLTNYVLVRSGADALGLTATIRDQIWSVDRDQPVSVVPMEEIVSGSLERRRLVLTLIGSFAALALLLAMVGTSGVIANSVAQRTHEFGVRIALGAGRSQLLAEALRQSLWNLGLGLGVGLAGATGVTRLMRSLLFGIGPADPLTLGSMAGILLVVALIASYIPARRATKVDPIVALRYD